MKIKKKKKRINKRVFIRSSLCLLFVVVLVAVLALFGRSWIAPAIQATSLSSNETVLPDVPEYQDIQLYERDGITYLMIRGHEMLLVNKTYHLPSTYGNGITSATRSAYDAMAAAASAAGHPIYIVSGYRSYQTQANLFAHNVNLYGSEEEANKISARPGQSEHQTGLGLDIWGYDSAADFSGSFGETPTGRWLAAHCAEYGFILRYPEGKIWATGYIYEPWHFRYVGVELAKILTDSGLTVEEYAGLVTQPAA